MSASRPKWLARSIRYASAPSPSQYSFSTVRALRKEEKETNFVKEPTSSQTGEQPKPRKKTMAELDEELRKKLAGMSDEGGAAGVEYENGKPVAMKQAVRSNMFRIMPFRGK